MDTVVASSSTTKDSATINYSKLGEDAGRKTIQYFDNLPRKGKPGPHEWTILASFLLLDNLSNGINFKSKTFKTS